MLKLKQTPELPQDRQHRVALLDNIPADQLLIHEIYQSIQGESTFAGLPCVFVRTAVCDYRCSWCDTPHAFSKGDRFTLEQVRQKVLSYECKLVEFTGGEPLLQAAGVNKLMTDFCDAGKTVLIETSGGRDISGIDKRVRIIMDLKCPDSDESEQNYWPNLDHLKPTDEIKFVMCSLEDWDWAEKTIREHKLDQRFQVLISRTFSGIKAKDLVTLILDSKLHIRFQLQMHKYIWEPNTKSV